MPYTPTPAASSTPKPSRHRDSDVIIYVEPDLIKSLLEVVRGSVRDCAIFTVGYWRGLRASEVGKLQTADYKPESKRLYVRRAKGSNSGEYTLCQAEVTALNAWVKVRGAWPGPLFCSRQQRGISRQMLDSLTKHYTARCVPPWPDEKRMFKVLRHSIATHLLAKGVDLYAVKDWLGHKSITSTEVYAKITNPVRRRAEALAYTDDTKPQGPTKAKIDWSKDSR